MSDHERDQLTDIVERAKHRIKGTWLVTTAKAGFIDDETIEKEIRRACLEAIAQELKALAELSKINTEQRQVIAELREQIDQRYGFRDDKERLDWMEANYDSWDYVWERSGNGKLRQAIDEAMKK